MISGCARQMCVNRPVWICLHRIEVINRAQQCSCEGVVEAAPYLVNIWSLYFLDVGLHRAWTGFPSHAHETLLWGEFDNTRFYGTCIVVLSAVCSRLYLGCDINDVTQSEITT